MNHRTGSIIAGAVLFFTYAFGCGSSGDTGLDGVAGASSEDAGVLQTTGGAVHNAGNGGSASIGDSGGSNFAGTPSSGGLNAGGGSGGGEAGTAGSGAGGIDTGGTNSGSGGSSTGGSTGQCAPLGELCSYGSDCCSGVCDPKSSMCSSNVSQCSASGASCQYATECCSLSCVNNSCQDQCTNDGLTCESGSECCSQNCDADTKTCIPLNTMCTTAGNSCGSGSECCSGLCGDDGRCRLDASFCVQQGDICNTGLDCCSGICNIEEGATAGTCAEPSPAETLCSLGVAGTVCSGCESCCSRLCAPYGPTGVFICLPAQGCRVNGELCKEDTDCCGGPDSGLPGEGTVTCDKQEGASVGRCRNPRASDSGPSCNPQGNICHKKDYACNISSSRNNCCGDAGGQLGVCQLDTLGIPRCNGLSSCRDPGETCSNSSDCCHELPCVPDDTGTLRCYAGDGSCVEGGGTCTVNADCCTGTTCVTELGSTQGACSLSEPPDGGTGGSGGVGGVGGAGGSSGSTSSGGGSGGTGGDTTTTCAEYGQKCNLTTDCCNSDSVECRDGACLLPAN